MRNVPKYLHNMSKTHKCSFSMGELIPIGFYDVLPGDVIRGGTDFFTRVAPMDAPPLSKLEVCIKPFYVPYRQIWDDAEAYFTGGAYGSTPPVKPTMNLFTRHGGLPIPEGSLAEMMGVTPGGTVTSRIVNALPFRAYTWIYNRMFLRDDVGSSPQLALSTASGNDTTTNISSVVVNWARDYFTGANPRQQKATDVYMEIERLASAPTWRAYNAGTQTVASAITDVQTDGAGDLQAHGPGANLSLDPRGGLVLNAREAREAMALQRYYERAERRQSDKYEDMAADLFGVSKQDLRLQEPLQLGSTKDVLKFTEILQTGVTTSGNPDGVGNFRGHGIGAARGRGYKQFIPEHGIVLYLAYIRPVGISYPDGIEKYWWKTLREQEYQPDLAHLSQQAIQNREVRADHTTPTGTFAYNDIYEEYRSPLSLTTGGFRSTYNYFHLDRFMTSDPTFNQTFLNCIPSSRIFQDTTADQFYSIAYHNTKMKRVVTPSGTPK